MTHIIIGWSVFIRQGFKNDMLVNYNVLVIILLLLFYNRHYGIYDMCHK